MLRALLPDPQLDMRLTERGLQLLDFIEQLPFTPVRTRQPALDETGGNVTQAAQLAKRNRTEFYKLLQRHNLTPSEFKVERA